MRSGYTLLTGSSEELSPDSKTKRRNRIVLLSAGITCAVLALYTLNPFHRAPHSPKPAELDSFLKPITLENASAVFNTVQGALRAKNSQIQPIGVGFIPAYIPEGTLLYHGNGDGEVPDGPEWIAMDHEFSYNFIGDRANPKGNRTDDRHGPPGGHKGPGDGHGGGKNSSRGGGKWGKGNPLNPSNDHTTLFTFQVTKPLTRMILFDGSSAAKTDTGEMDQQGILARMDPEGSVNERTAADKICSWGKKFGLDGYIRIENGFEGVICDFKDKLAVVSNLKIEWSNDTLGLPLEFEGAKGDDYGNLTSQIKAMASYDWTKQGNIHDKREGRIQLDFRGFQTPVNKTYVSPDTYLRRILNISDDVKEEIITGLETFLIKGSNPSAGTDWQLMTTEIVDKFAPLLQMLNRSVSTFSEDESSLLNTAKNLTVFSNNFVRRFMNHEYANDSEAQLLHAKADAVNEYVHFLQEPQSESEILIYSSLYTVTSSIVDVMFSSFLAGRDMLQTHYLKEAPLAGHIDQLKALKAQISRVISTIQWESTFYRCDRVCDWDEICYTPSWGPSPLGWGGNWGTHEENGRNRIDNPLQCISYRTILNERRRDH
ncbi:CYFA0S05e00518g1_1 [Cyberlindnera fabianii]|uniref:CYFA0S05e00518g1_1 n=1 Tax=Cyberlindnera fabianii TaxID=36022 RepID=A0A061B0C5_CYBFA|nr:hypothetical protein BON22_2245 [Cyberlindnera fabianii]CDR40440.1 CYFA0S05e00518g1_1 [Cyberlindnera fabianii]